MTILLSPCVIDPSCIKHMIKGHFIRKPNTNDLVREYFSLRIAKTGVNIIYTKLILSMLCLFERLYGEKHTHNLNISHPFKQIILNEAYGNSPLSPFFQIIKL